MSPTPLLVIVGPTASGKSQLSLAAAEALDGEIVSADAFAVYRGMDIGTDKPSAADRKRVPHHLVDVADPRERFSAGDFCRLAHQAIAEIRERGKTPIVAGGTHFYIRSLLVGLFSSPPHDPALRQRLERRWEDNSSELVRRLVQVDPETARRVGPADRQRILRALEVWELSGRSLTDHWRRQRRTRRYDALIVAPVRSRSDLYAKIDQRVNVMFSSGFVEEVGRLLARGVPPESHAMKAIGYRQVMDHLEGKLSLEAAIESTQLDSRRFAKRQLSWIRHMSEGEPHWIPPLEDGGLQELIRLWNRHL